MLGNFTESVIADVRLFNPDWNLVRGLCSFLMNWPLLGMGVVKTGTWKSGWLWSLCSTSPTAVVPVLTPGSLSKSTFGLSIFNSLTFSFPKSKEPE